MKLARTKLHHRAFGPRRPSLEAARDLAIAGVLERGGFGRELRDPLAYRGIVPRTAAVAPDRLRQSGQFQHLVGVHVGVADAGALEHQRGDCDLPSVVLFADDIFLRYADILEEDFIEAALPRYLG